MDDLSTSLQVLSVIAALLVLALAGVMLARVGYWSGGVPYRIARIGVWAICRFRSRGA
jgi:hypothetical protein